MKNIDIFTVLQKLKQLENRKEELINTIANFKETKFNTGEGRNNTILSLVEELQDI